ncbi:hypothetical protein DFJ74DRAFT_459335 [Hyaloraphidium curvatum]|nr:hypothetical protein DFJ74DRAFT_459335 [Hyaloraphidium curvatum]
MVNCKVPPSKRSPAHKLDIGNFFFVDDHGAELEACKNCMEHNGQKHPSRFSKQNLCTNGTCQRRVYMNVEGRPLCFKCGTAANQKLTGTTESIAIYSYESQRCSGGCGRRPHFRAEDSGTWCRDCSTREGVPVKPMHDMCSTCASVIPHYTSPTVPGFFCASCAPDDASDPYAHYCPECPDLIRGNFRLDELWYCAPHGRPLGAVKVFDVCAFPGCGLEPRKEADEDGLRRCAKHGGWSAYAFFELLLDFLAEKGLESKFRVQINGVTVTIKLLHSEPQVSFLETLRRLDFLRLLTIDGSSNEKIVDEEEMDEKAHLKNLDDDVARQREVINGTLDFTTRTPEVQAFGARKLFGSFRVAETDPLAEIKKAYTAAARRALPADGTIARPGTTEALRETAEAALRADGFLTVKGKEAVASRSLVKKWFDGHWDKGTVVGESLKKLAKQRAELYAAHLVRVIEFTREVAAADKAAEQGKKRPSTNLAFPITLVGHEPRAVDKFKELEREGIAKVYARPGLG